ncbi:MAG: hypothetical protein KC419_07070, partial [Anaerolineales bacterium]|nr:hypothetical protein [Anaerolineales bacterium]
DICSITCYSFDKVLVGRLALACLLFGQKRVILPLDISPYYFGLSPLRLVTLENIPLLFSGQSPTFGYISFLRTLEIMR